MNLLGTLGLGEVSADPNDIADGKYDGDIFKSEYVLSKDKTKVSHVVTFRVTEGENKGAQRQQWYTLGKNPKGVNDSEPDKVDDIVAYEPGLTDQQKTYYKKLWLDLGFPEHAVDAGAVRPEDMVGKQVTFGVKRNGGYININFVELRESSTPVPVTEADVTGSGSGPTSLPF